MKIKLPLVVIVTLLLNLKSYCQYKDLEGVFFGKVISLGVGGSLQKYSDQSISGTGSSITPLIYSVFINNKVVSSLSLSFHNKVHADFQGNDGYADYSQTAEIKQFELALAYRFALTREGVSKPFSAFLNIQTGLLSANVNITDSRYGDYYEDQGSNLFIGGGLTFYQRLGSRFIAFAEPVYRYTFGYSTGKIYLGDYSEKTVGLSHFSGQLGIMFLIGKSE